MCRKEGSRSIPQGKQQQIRAVQEGEKLEDCIREVQTKLVAGFNIEDRPIEVLISGPDQPDLTIIDLPGLIQTRRGRCRSADPMRLSDPSR